MTEFKGYIHGSIDIISEYCHPAGPVIYTVFNDVEFEGYDGKFLITDRNELRRV